MSRSLIVAGEERVLAAESDGPDRALDGVGGDLDAAVIEEADEPVPMLEAIADRLADRLALGDARQAGLEPGL